MQVGPPALRLSGHFHRCCSATDIHLEFGAGGEFIVHFLCLDLPDVVLFYFSPKKGGKQPVLLQELIFGSRCPPIAVCLCILTNTFLKLVCGESASSCVSRRLCLSGFDRP